MATAYAAHSGRLNRLTAGMPILYGGNRVTHVSEALAAAFEPGDRLIVVQETGDLLHVRRLQHEIAARAVAEARSAFDELQSLPDARIDRFYRELGARLEDEAAWRSIAEVNARDVARAREQGRSTTRLVADDRMRRRMIDGVAQWSAMPSSRGRVVETVRHEGWHVEHVLDGLGVVGFVFEGRPNVLADATGILRTGNTTALRIGSDALATARAIMDRAVRPALDAASLPLGAVSLVDSADRAAGWALFSDPRLSLAVARGSGPAVAQLGAIARQAGLPVSLHGAGGAWLVADATADADYLQAVAYHSLDRKVCNTLNTACVVEDAAERLVPRLVAACESRGRANGHGFRLHVTARAARHVPGDMFGRRVGVSRATGLVEEPLASRIDEEMLGHEWEWEATPELALATIESVEEAVGLFNRLSPRFVASLISEDRDAHDRFFRAIDSPFVGNGTTRWVDGQFALGRPELGLTNWQRGRLFGRGGILTGDGVYSVRLRARQTSPDVHQ